MNSKRVVNLRLNFKSCKAVSVMCSKLQCPYKLCQQIEQFEILRTEPTEPVVPVVACSSRTLEDNSLASRCLSYQSFA